MQKLKHGEILVDTLFIVTDQSLLHFVNVKWRPKQD